MEVKKAIIPAAGLGTRFLPVTKAIPKEMLPIVDKPIIQYIIEEAIASGIEEILIITGKNKRDIEDYFDKSIELELILEDRKKEDLLALVKGISSMVNIHYIRQKEPKGLGDAINYAKHFVGNEAFAVLLGDDIIQSPTPYLKGLIEVYNKYQRTIIGVHRVSMEEVINYGIIDGIPIDEGIYKIKNLMEKPSIEEAPSNIAILGRYIIRPEIFNLLDNIEPGFNGEVQLTDALGILLQQQGIYGYLKDDINYYDVGSKLGFLKATVDFALKRDEIKNEFKHYLEELLNLQG